MTIIEFISNNEGRKKKPYRCSQGFLTVGVGYNIDAHPLPVEMQSYLDEHGEITEAMIDQLLEVSIPIATEDCAALFPDFDTFSDNRKMALIDFLFNVGMKTAMQFDKSIHLINIGHWEEAAINMRKSRWAQQVKKRAVTVTKMIEEG